MVILQSKSTNSGRDAPWSSDCHQAKFRFLGSVVGDRGELARLPFCRTDRGRHQPHSIDDEWD